jgi:hypothetical protein
MHTPATQSPTAAPPHAAGAAHATPAGRRRAADYADELSDDDLEQVVGGLARTWTEALRGPRARA